MIPPLLAGPIIVTLLPIFAHSLSLSVRGLCPSPSLPHPQGLFNALLPGIKVVLDLILANGIPLPSIDGLSLVDPTVQFDQGFFAIATNFAFKPPVAATPHAEG